MWTLVTRLLDQKKKKIHSKILRISTISMGGNNVFLFGSGKEDTGGCSIGLCVAKATHPIPYIQGNSLFGP